MKYDNQKATIFMKAALDEAQKAFQVNEVPIGCVIVKNDKIIARGFNYREHSQLTTDHAEIRAISEANRKLSSWRLNDCQLFVTLEPCAMCCGAILNARITEVYYATADLKAGMAGTLENLLDDSRLNHQVHLSKGICSGQSLNLLQDFFSEKRDKKTGLLK